MSDLVLQDRKSIWSYMAPNGLCWNSVITSTSLKQVFAVTEILVESSCEIFLYFDFRCCFADDEVCNSWCERMAYHCWVMKAMSHRASPPMWKPSWHWLKPIHHHQLAACFYWCRTHYVINCKMYDATHDYVEETDYMMSYHLLL